jgi:hypothetical protein
MKPRTIGIRRIETTLYSLTFLTVHTEYSVYVSGGTVRWHSQSGGTQVALTARWHCQVALTQQTATLDCRYDAVAQVTADTRRR